MLEKILRVDDKDIHEPKVYSTFNESDIFSNPLQKAAEQVEKILISTKKFDVNYQNRRYSFQPDSKKEEVKTVTNIISFFGDRGEGKTSILLSFREMLKNHDIKLFSESYLNNVNFVLLDVIDPGTFEDFSTILDVVLGHMLDEIKDKIYSNKTSDEYRKLLPIISSLYEQYSIIKDKKVLSKYNEVYDGAIEVLSKINEVRKFRTNLYEFISEYLDLCSYSREQRNVLVVTIDDMDIALSHSYDILEEIRKYLNFDNVLILMSAKLEQLHEGVRLELLKDYSGVVRYDEKRVYSDVYEMATKYLSKLIPESRRIFLPNIMKLLMSGVYEVKLEYIGNEISKEKNPSGYLIEYFSELFFERTGILMLKTNQYYNYLLDGNLRSIIDLLDCILHMDVVKNDNDFFTYYKNIQKFKSYFLYNWCTEHLDYQEARFIRSFCKDGKVFKNHDFIGRIKSIAEKDYQEIIINKLQSHGKWDLFYDLSDIVEIIQTIENHQVLLKVGDNSKFIYALKMCYTILLSELYYAQNKDTNEVTNFIRFVGGRVKKDNKMLEFDNASLLSDKSDINKLTPYLLLTLTQINRDMDINFYSINANESRNLFLSPYMFFVNGSYVDYLKNYNSYFKNGDYFTKKTKNAKDLSVKMQDKHVTSLSTINSTSEPWCSIEIVSKTIVCNYFILEYYLNFMANHINEEDSNRDNYFRVLELTHSWLELIRSNINGRSRGTIEGTDLPSSLSQLNNNIITVKNTLNHIMKMKDIFR